MITASSIDDMESSWAPMLDGKFHIGATALKALLVTITKCDNLGFYSNWEKTYLTTCSNILI